MFFNSLNNPKASLDKAPNFLDRSISACSLEIVTLTYKFKSFALFVDSRILSNSSFVSKAKSLTLYLKICFFNTFSTF